MDEIEKGCFEILAGPGIPKTTLPVQQSRTHQALIGPIAAKLDWTSAMQACGQTSKNIGDKSALAPTAGGEVLFSRTLRGAKRMFVDDGRVVTRNWFSYGMGFVVFILARLVLPNRCPARKHIVNGGLVPST
jgi:hypothetical protein